MKVASLSAILLIVLWAVLTVVQIWSSMISVELYWKITITMMLIGGGIIAAALISREYLSEKQMKKDKFFD